MGRDLGIGLAIKIYVKRKGYSFKGEYSTEEILDKLKEKLDLSLYKVNNRYSDYLVLELNEEIAEKNIVSFLEEEKEFLDKYDKKEVEEAIELLKNEGYKKVIEKKNSIGCCGFQYLEGNILSNDIGYLDDDLDMFCDGVFFTLKEKSF